MRKLLFDIKRRVSLQKKVQAVFSGLSRSGTTLSVGLLRGLNKQTALDYTFVLAIPSILAAALLETKEALESPAGIQVEVLPVVFGMVTAAVVGYFSIVLFKWFLKTDKTMVFVFYTAIIGAIVVIISIIELLSGVNIFTGQSLSVV